MRALRSVAAVLSLLLVLPAFAQEQSTEDSRIVLVRRKGTVSVWSASQRQWQDLPVRSAVNQGAYIKTEKESEAILGLGKKAAVTLSENTVVAVASALFDNSGIKNVRIQAHRGKVWSVVEKIPTAASRFEIETPNAIAGVRGTVFATGYDPATNATQVACVTGEVGVSSRLVEGYVILKANMSTTIVANKPPVPPQVLDERLKQEWDNWRQSIPFSEMGIVGGIAEINAIQIQEAERTVNELRIAKKGSEKVAQDFEAIEAAIFLYFADTRAVPEKLADLMVNPGAAAWKGPYLGAGTNFMDPYGRPYRYRIRTTPRGNPYIELSTYGMIGAAGDTYGQETRVIRMDKLQEDLEKKLKEAGK